MYIAINYKQESHMNFCLIYQHNVATVVIILENIDLGKHNYEIHILLTSSTCGITTTPASIIMTGPGVINI